MSEEGQTHGRKVAKGPAAWHRGVKRWVCGRNLAGCGSFAALLAKKKTLAQHGMQVTDLVTRHAT